MNPKSDPQAIAAAAAAIVKGARSRQGRFSYDQFISLLDLVAKQADDRADVVVSLVDGLALVRFPALSSQVLEVTDDTPLTRERFRFPGQWTIQVFGGERRSARRLFLDDLDRARVVVGLIGVGLVAAFASGSTRDLVNAISGPLSLASGLFFTIFVLFGVGEVVRTSSLTIRTFKTGQLQRFLDADRYLVRLAVVTFVSVNAIPVTYLLWDRLAAFAPTIVSLETRETAMDVSALLLISLAVVSAALAVMATAGYLVDRAAGTTLMDAGTEALLQVAGPADVMTAQGAEASTPQR